MWSSVRERFPIWYFDSTGGVIKNIENQSPPFLFSIVFHDKDKKLIMPLAEFISTAHDSHSISGYLYSIKLELERVLTKQTFQVAPIICTDFSFALLNAVCNVFNNCTLEFYLKWCFEVLFKKAKSLSISNCMKVLLHLCGAHFLKMVVKKVQKIKKYKEDVDIGFNNNINKNKNLQKSFIFAFVLLQSSTNIDDFIEYFINIHNLYNEKYNSDAVRNSGEFLKKKLQAREFEVLSIYKEPCEPEFKLKKKDENYHEFAKYNCCNKNNESILKKNSQFSLYFQTLLTKIQKKSEPININEENEYYCSEMFNIIMDYLYVIPLWTLLTIERWQQMNSKYKNLVIQNLTNNPVENWFNQVKNNILQGNSTSPSIHASKMDAKIEAEYYIHYKIENIRLKRNNKSLADEKETFKKIYKRNVRPGYLSAIGSNRLLAK